MDLVVPGRLFCFRPTSVKSAKRPLVFFLRIECGFAGAGSRLAGHAGLYLPIIATSGNVLPGAKLWNEVLAAFVALSLLLACPNSGALARHRHDCVIANPSDQRPRTSTKATSENYLRQ